ncbi:MAG: hypothetical protein KUG82_01370 [Pseudomonadales bacterium]|nr:hypothetical protein [Pseudomonadales bacterium]
MALILSVDTELDEANNNNVTPLGRELDYIPLPISLRKVGHILMMLMKYIALSFVLLLAGCGFISDELLNCLNRELEFSQSTIPPAVLNQEYQTTISAAIRHTPDDDVYSYRLSLSGDLPSGLEYYRSSSSRHMEFRGTPLESGDFPFELRVSLPMDDEDLFCGENVLTQSYTLRVSVM